MPEPDRHHESFYADLAPFDEFAGVADPRHYRPVPRSWLVVITDVLGSTAAIEQGRYKDVNSLGVASIVALRNALPDVDLPYVFGGDGATVLVPGSRRSAALAALRGVRELARDAFGLTLRAGIVAVDELAAEGFELRVARFRVSPGIALAMMSGSGITEAERRIKDEVLGARYAVDDDGPSRASFEGFECRWRPIPSRRGAAMSLLVSARSADQGRSAAIYRRVLEGIQGLLAEAAPGRPVEPESLDLHGAGHGFDQEARVRSGRSGGLAFAARKLVAKLSAALGGFLIARGRRAFGFPGDRYLELVTANTDFRKFDEVLRMVIDVSPEERAAIEELLESERRDGHLFYGIHTAPTSLMTCAIDDYIDSHVHFVDGSEGGYAVAAKQLKRQMAAARDDH